MATNATALRAAKLGLSPGTTSRALFRSRGGSAWASASRLRSRCLCDANCGAKTRRIDGRVYVCLEFRRSGRDSFGVHSPQNKDPGSRQAEESLHAPGPGPHHCRDYDWIKATRTLSICPARSSQRLASIGTTYRFRRSCRARSIQVLRTSHTLMDT